MEELNIQLEIDDLGQRLDQALAKHLPQYSRSKIQGWLKEGRVLVDELPAKASHRVAGDEWINIEVPDEQGVGHEAEDIPLTIMYEDNHLLVIDKGAGFVVHPAPGNPTGTVLNAVLHHSPKNAALPRGGIVHRLDKDTTGLMVIAKSELARQTLIEQLSSREMTREYQALVNGAMTGGGKVDAPIGRHSHDRKRMAVMESGKPAVTHYRLMHRFARHTHIKCRLETGRTHQIRVHMANIGHPIVGDPVYAGRQAVPAGLKAEDLITWRTFKRQALHAAKLILTHPATGEDMRWEAPVPEDMQSLLHILAAQDKNA